MYDITDDITIIMSILSFYGDALKTKKHIVLFTHRRRWCFHMGQVAYMHFHCIW